MLPPRVRELIEPHRWLMLGAFAAAMGDSLLALLGPWPLKVALDSVLGKHPAPAWLTGWLGSDKQTLLAFVAIATLAIAVLGAFFSYLQKHLIATVGEWIGHDLRKSLYDHMQRLSMAFHKRAETGDLISRVTADISSVQSFLTTGLLNSLVQSLTLIGMVLVMFYMNWRFTLVALSVAPLLFFVVFHYTRQIKKFSRDLRKKEGRVASLVQEVLTSMQVVKAFAREDYEQERLEKKSLEAVEAALKSRGLKARLTPLVDIIVAIGTAVVLWYGGRLALDGQLSAGSLVVFLAYLSKLYKPMQELSKLSDTYSKALVGWERIQEVLSLENDVRDVRGAKAAPRFRGEIELRDVKFAYGENTVLDGVSLKIEAGQTAALVGPTGSGKSTILALLSRFYDPQSGTVLIDGHDIRCYRQQSLREQISVVLQDAVLFQGAIWENIAYGNPSATRQQIIEAAEMANVAEFVEKMPDGYDAEIGERGETLSGGQRQRIAIARALIRSTPILLLDEPSSGLDAASEKLVFEALDRLIENRTSVIVAHRLSTIKKADVIFVVRDGKIIERGNHAELLEAGGFYAELCAIQFGAPETALAGE